MSLESIIKNINNIKTQINNTISINEFINLKNELFKYYSLYFDYSQSLLFDIFEKSDKNEK